VILQVSSYKLIMKVLLSSDSQLCTMHPLCFRW